MGRFAYAVILTVVMPISIAVPVTVNSLELVFSSGVHAAIAAKMEIVERKAISRLIWCYMVAYPANILI